MKRQRLLIESIRYITGTQKSVKLKGKSSELLAFQNVLKASKNLYETLQTPEANLQKVEQLVAIKNKAAKQFREITGQSWPL